MKKIIHFNRMKRVDFTSAPCIPEKNFNTCQVKSLDLIFIIKYNILKFQFFYNIMQTFSIFVYDMVFDVYNFNIVNFNILRLYSPL